jgi:hypothetical protein
MPRKKKGYSQSRRSHAIRPKYVSRPKHDLEPSLSFPMNNFRDEGEKDVFFENDVSDRVFPIEWTEGLYKSSKSESESDSDSDSNSGKSKKKKNNNSDSDNKDKTKQLEKKHSKSESDSDSSTGKSSSDSENNNSDSDSDSEKQDLKDKQIHFLQQEPLNEEEKEQQQFLIKNRDLDEKTQGIINIPKKYIYLADDYPKFQKNYEDVHIKNILHNTNMNVEEDLKRALQKIQLKNIYFIDDLQVAFTLNPRQTLDFLKNLIAKLNLTNIKESPWLSCNNDCELDKFTNVIIEKFEIPTSSSQIKQNQVLQPLKPKAITYEKKNEDLPSEEKKSEEKSEKEESKIEKKEEEKKNILQDEHLHPKNEEKNITQIAESKEDLHTKSEEKKLTIDNVQDYIKPNLSEKDYENLAKQTEDNILQNMFLNIANKPVEKTYYSNTKLILLNNFLKFTESDINFSVDDMKKIIIKSFILNKKELKNYCEKNKDKVIANKNIQKLNQTTCENLISNITSVILKEAYNDYNTSNLFTSMSEIFGPLDKLLAQDEHLHPKIEEKKITIDNVQDYIKPNLSEKDYENLAKKTEDDILKNIFLNIAQKDYPESYENRSTVINMNYFMKIKSDNMQNAKETVLKSFILNRKFLTKYCEENKSKNINNEYTQNFNILTCQDFIKDITPIILKNAYEDYKKLV